MNSKQRSRARLILGSIFVAAAALVGTLYTIQVVRGKDYVSKAEKQYSKPVSALFDRGSISFTAKDGSQPSAAILDTEYIIYMSPKSLPDPESVYEALSQYVDIDHEDFIRKASLTNDPYEEIIHQADEAIVQSVRDLALKGIGIGKKTVRSYPGGRLASHTIGIVGENTGTIEGRYGLERAYENILSRPDKRSSTNVFAQIFSTIQDSVKNNNESAHGDVVASIEPTVQSYLEKVLTRTAGEWKPDEIGGIIMDPATGNIIAQAVLPDFDPNDVSASIKSISVLSNPLVENAYEMGSIMKPLTVAIGLDSGAITPTWTYKDEGTLTLNDKKISNFDGRPRGITSVQEILSQSLNVGVATIALKVGKETFARYFTSFGFGEKTGIDQPNETTGLVTNLTTGRDIEIATMAYGQGIALSPIAMTRALAVLANKGQLVRPKLGRKIDYLDGTSRLIETTPGKVVLKPQTVEIVTRLLVKVVDEALRNGALKMEHYSIAAKTGTAQIADPSIRGYYPDRYLHSFFGYFPAYEPRFIVFLYQKYPKGAQYASETLATPFSDLSKFLIDYYNVPPDR